MIGEQRTRRRQYGSVGHGGELLSQECTRTLNFKPSQPGPRKDVPAMPLRYRYLRESEDAAGKVLSDVSLNPAGARRGTNQTKRLACFSRYRPGVLETRLDRCCVP